MAGINDFLKERWTVDTPVPRALTGLLPARGCTISFHQDASTECCMVAATAKAEKRFEGFKLKNGRLERQIPDTNKLVIVEVDKPARGGRGGKGGKGAKARLKGWLKVGEKTMQGTWGAEAGSGSGGGSGRTGSTYPAGTGAS